jgi:hypothetical protein
MQLIAEAYDILKRGLGIHEDEIADIFLKWNKGVLDSFLIDITANILKFKDDDGVPLVEKILDQAGQKGTGKWTAINALDAGMPVTLIGEAVFARCLSAIKSERMRASKVIAGPAKEAFKGDKQQFIDDLEQALYASKIISYTQGFMLMRQTAKDLDWNLNYAGIAQMWRGGCIIKSVFLGDITAAYHKTPELESLLFDDFFNKGRHLIRLHFSQRLTWASQPCTRRSPAGAASSRRLCSGVSRPRRSALRSPSSTATAARSCPRTCSRPSVTTSARTPSRSCPARRTTASRPARTSVSRYDCSECRPILMCSITDINWTGRGGNVSASSYSA